AAATTPRRPRSPALRPPPAPARPAGRLGAAARNRPDRRPQHPAQGTPSRPGQRHGRAGGRPRPATQARLPAGLRPGRRRAEITTTVRPEHRRGAPKSKGRVRSPSTPLRYAQDERLETENANVPHSKDDPAHDSRFLRALRREPVDRTPVWLMRQAGRYLPEYRATRKAAGSFLAMAKNPELACEVTLQPLRRFPLDAAILFSDILTVPDAMGLRLYFGEGEGPTCERPARTAADIARLGVPHMGSDLRYVTDAVSTIRREVDNSVPLIGFSGSPWTLACYMVEGGGSKDFARVKSLALNDPAAMHRLLEVTTDAVIAYLSAQRAAGAQALQVFDTWGGVLSPAMYREFSLRYLKRIAAELERGEGTDRTPLILFGK